MTISTLPLTDLGSAAAAVVSNLHPLPAGVTRFHCPDDKTWHALRSKDVTASVAAALLGAHPWETPFGLFSAKKGLHVVDMEETGPMKRGRLLESVAVKLLREERPNWRIRHNDGEDRYYYRNTEWKIGATPDVEAFDPERGLGAVQIKSVGGFAYRKNWMVDGAVEPPVWIAIQALIEAALIGATWAAVTPIVVDDAGVTMPIIDVPLHAGIMTKVREAVKEFWRRVEENDPYPPDYARDGALIAALYSDPADVEVDLSDNRRMQEIMVARDELKAREADGADAAKERKKCDAEIIYLLGNASRARIPGGRILEAKMVNRKGFTVEPTSFRQIRVKDAR